MAAGSWTQVRKVDFGTTGAATFMLRAKGKGSMEIRLDSKTAKPAATLDFSSSAFDDFKVELDASKFKNVHTVYFVFTDATNAYFDAWQFAEVQPDAIEAIHRPTSNDQQAAYDLSGRRLKNTNGRRGLMIVDGKVVQLPSR